MLSCAKKLIAGALLLLHRSLERIEKAAGCVRPSSAVWASAGFPHRRTSAYAITLTQAQGQACSSSRRGVGPADLRFLNFVWTSRSAS